MNEWNVYTYVYIRIYYVYRILVRIPYILELAVLALARIMCANIHSQNGTAILAQELLSRK